MKTSLEKPKKHTPKDTQAPSLQTIALGFPALSMIGILVVVPPMYTIGKLTGLGATARPDPMPRTLIDDATTLYYALGFIYAMGTLVFMVAASRSAWQNISQHTRPWICLKLINILSISATLLLILFNTTPDPSSMVAQPIEILTPNLLTNTGVALFAAYCFLIPSSLLLFLPKFLRKN